MSPYHTHNTKKAAHVMSFVLTKSTISPKIRRSILTPPSMIISCRKFVYIKGCLHGSILGGGFRIGRLFSGESFKVRKYVKKVVFETVRYKGVPHRMKTCQVADNEHLVRRELVAMVQICVRFQMLVDSTWTPAPKVECLDLFQQLLIAMMTNCFHLVMLSYFHALMLRPT